MTFFLLKNDEKTRKCYDFVGEKSFGFLMKNVNNVSPLLKNCVCMRACA